MSSRSILERLHKDKDKYLYLNMEVEGLTNTHLKVNKLQDLQEHLQDVQEHPQDQF